MNSIPYQKISGAGNTFVVIDGRDLPAGTDLSKLAREGCGPEHAHGGTDGLIVIAGSDERDFEMKYYNRDGSTGMMCGNGGRCAVLFAAEHGYVRDRDNLSFTNAGIAYNASLTELGVRLSFPDPNSFDLHRKLSIDGVAVPCHFGDVGTPHAVIFVNELAAGEDKEEGALDRLDLNVWGSAVRRHPDFGSEGANANFADLLPEGGGIRLRTFERGVEAETGACGTGAAASAIIAAMLYGLKAPVTVIPTSNSPLRVGFRFTAPDRVTDVTLEGGAEVLMEGELDVPTDAGRQPETTERES